MRNYFFSGVVEILEGGSRFLDFRDGGENRNALSGGRDGGKEGLR